jgi:hypothetical protein
VNWKGSLNDALVRATGFEIRRRGSRRRVRPQEPSDRLLVAPAFVMCTVRSGSTLLRVLLDSHSQVHSPQELHLRDLKATIGSDYAQRALEQVGLDDRQLEYLLWDRVLHRELEETGKRILVNKTPGDVFIVDRIVECWPDARFIYLLRHPLAIARSRLETRPQDSEERNLKMVLRYANALEAARAKHPGLTVRYEDLAADPASATKRLCEFLGVRWERRMLDYGRFDHGRYKPGLGDWKDNIKSGQVQAPAPLPAPEEVPPELRGIAVAWGYLPAEGRAGAPAARPEAQQAAAPQA